MIVKNITAILCLGVIGCGTVPSVRPIGKGEKSLTLSSGGPVTSIHGIKMPLPYTVLRYRQGWTDHTDFHAGVHPTMLILGNLAIDLGLTREVIQQSGWRPSLSLAGNTYGFFHFSQLSSIRAYPELSLLGSYRLGNRRDVLYFGMQNMIQCTRPYVVSAPFVGLEVPFKRCIVLNLETKWYGPAEESEDRAADYSIKPLGYGALGFVWGLSYQF